MLKQLQKIWHFFSKRHPRKTLLGIAFLLLWYWFSLPSPLFNQPTSLVLGDRNGDLLGAKIATDGQWRFPYSDFVPEKFEKALLEFEDRRFYKHPGVDPIGLGRAMLQNIRNRRIVSGGSTISMQVIRMAKKAPSRNIFQKFLETIIATRLEIKYSKKEILAYYSSNAPFGGNVVGLDAASWRYYGKQAALLSWSEAATLAVLPNSPGLIHPGRNRQALFEKRNRLLKRLFDKGDIDKFSYELALEEPLPIKPHSLPRFAPHLLERVNLEYNKKSNHKPSKIKTTLDINLQKASSKILKRHNRLLKNNDIHNICAVIIEVKSGAILTYNGNVPGSGMEHGEAVDILNAPRSPGSSLKPHLYALMLHEGEITPNTLISDIPTQLTGYRPENFYESYDGVVTAKRAIVRSLNVPLVRMLQEYGLEKFHYHLKNWGFRSINKPPQHYGLPLILGGGEVTLLELTNSYACMARVLNHFHPNDGKYNSDDFRAVKFYVEENELTNKSNKLEDTPPFLNASAIWQTFEALQDLERPTSQGEWKKFENSHQIAWKTGTSFGFRDAWAVGVTPKFAVGVWAGNADGEGRPGLVGVKAAAPILFDLFELLPHSNWFDPPLDELSETVICKESGFAALAICPRDTILTAPMASRIKPCRFHEMVHLNAGKDYLVHSNCYDTNEMVQEVKFVLPPVEEYYYKVKNPNYETLPPFLGTCIGSHSTLNAPMQLIYPKHSTKIYIPVDLDGNMSKTVFKAAHRRPETTIYWHLNNEYIGSTKSFHDLELNPQAGKYLLVLVDEKGNRLEQKFEIIEKN